MLNPFLYIETVLFQAIQFNWPIGLVVECLPMGQETRVQSQIKSYQRL